MNSLLAHLYNAIVPHEGNQHHAHLIRPWALSFWLLLILTVIVSTNIFFSTKPQVLGFSTNINIGKIIELTNQERQKNHLSTLKENPVLDQAALNKGMDMIKKNYWSHFAPDGTTPWYFFGQAGYHYIEAGENLARDFYTSDAVVAAWMNSPSHRENILNKDFQEIGVAEVLGQLNGKDTVLVVQLFGTPAVLSADIKAQEFIPEKVEVSSNINDKVKNLGVTQQSLIPILVFLSSLYLIDLVVLWRKKIDRKSHSSLLHFAVLIVLTFSIILISRGAIL